MGDEVVLLVEDDLIPYYIYQCRICHEEEEKKSKSMEAPCACSGTLKFAHRECIQKWCNEKGNTTCEICLQKFEPGYTAPKKTKLSEIAVTIRGSLEVPRQNQELNNHGLMAIVAATDDDIAEDDYAQCSSASERSVSCIRSVALAFTIILLIRQLVSVLTGAQDQYAFSIFTLLVLRASGILLPFYIMMRTIEAIQRRQHQQFHEADDEAEEDEHLQHTVRLT